MYANRFRYVCHKKANRASIATDLLQKYRQIRANDETRIKQEKQRKTLLFKTFFVTPSGFKPETF